MESTWAGVAVVLLVLPSLTGCVTEGKSLDGQCDLWTRNRSVEEGVRAHVHVQSDQAKPACVEVRFGGEQVAKVPVEGPDDEPLEGGNATLEWPSERFTVRAEERFSDRWASQAVDLSETPHVAVEVTPDGITVETSSQAPGVS